MTESTAAATAPRLRDTGSSSDAAVRPRRASILLIDHDADVTDALETLLADLPRVEAVATVPDPETAFDRLAAGTPLPDVIFIDPRCRGSLCLAEAAVLRQLRARAPHAAIVLLCVYPRVPERLRGLATRVVRKDITRRDLRALIDDLLAGGDVDGTLAAGLAAG